MSQGTKLSFAGDARSAQTVDAERTYAKVTWRLVPLLFVCYVLNFMDRTNIGFAQLQMKSQLGFDDQIFGIAASIFFVGYALFEVPSNLWLQRIGARATLLRIMLGWGAVSAATMAVTTPGQFYVARFLLGVFEAGFFPGVIYYLSQWYPDQRRARVIALFLTAVAVAPLISGPLSGAVMTFFDGEFGLRGWQWLLIVEGVPSMFIGVVTYFFLSDRPSQAKWLSNHERRLLDDSLKAEGHQTIVPQSGLRRIVFDWRVYVLGFTFFLVLLGGYSLAFWLASMLRSFGLISVLQIGLYSTIPAAAGIAAMIAIGRSSDLSGERRWHFALSSFAGALGLSLAAVFHHNLAVAITSLALAYAGIAGCIPVFWTVPTAFLPKSGAAGGIALINTIAVTAGAVGPALTGFLRKATGDFVYALHFFSGGLVLAAILMVACMNRSQIARSMEG